MREVWDRLHASKGALAKGAADMSDLEEHFSG